MRWHAISPTETGLSTRRPDSWLLLPWHIRTSGQRKKVTNDYILKEVLKAEKKIADRGVKVTTGRVIAEQTLGFWNSFYETHHYALLAGVPCRIFKKLPSGYGRKEVNDIIVQVRELRNRINHNEPICFVNRKCDFSYVKNMYVIISDFLTWIDPEIMPSLREVDKVCKIIEKEENKQKQWLCKN